VAVLWELVARAGQVVTKEELFTRVWPKTVVGEATLTSFIRLLRRALKDDPRRPRYIATVHRQGYRFIGQVVSSQEEENQKAKGKEQKAKISDSSPVPSPQPLAPVLVGREAELTQLHSLFAKALNGERQIVFVVGEAGVGKTTLVDAVLEGFRSWELGSSATPLQTPNPKAQIPNPGAWIALGQCIEHHGAGEPYLPVLEALGRLGRRPGGERLVATLDEHAPTWLAQLPTLLSPRELEAVQRRGQGMTRERMLRELAETLDVVTAEYPLVLVLEDLHWSDPSTVELLAALARRREAARLLVLGTYRPVDLVVTNHPLKAVKHELVARGQATEILLGNLSREAVHVYVTRRLGRPVPQYEMDELAAFVHKRTEGHPLFMVQVTDYLFRQEAGEKLTQAVRQRVPGGLQQLIEIQLARVGEEAQQVLAVASVMGAEFATASVAAGLQKKVEAIEARCEELAREGQFIEDRGAVTWPDGTVSERYGFRHALYQQVLYAQIPEARRVRLHKVIGEREEQAYGELAYKVAAELAVHFEQGHDFRRAVQYLQAAAENALRRNANAEAILLLTRALELLQAWPDTPARAQQELTLHFALGAPLIALKGYAAPEVAHAHARVRELCRQLGDTPQLFPALLGLSGFHFARAELHTARELAELCFTPAQRGPSSTRLMWVHYTLGQVLCCQGEFARAKDHLEQGLTLYQPQKHSRFVAHAVQDPQVSSLCFLAVVLWFLGYVDQALATIHKAQVVAQELAHPFSLAWALDYAARLHQFCRETPTAREKTETLITLSQEQGFTHYLPGGMIRRGWILSEQGHGEEGIAQMRQGLATYRATVAELERPYYLALLADAHGKNGQPEEGLGVLAEAVAVVERTGERYYEAELWRMKGELLLAQEVKSQNAKVKSQKSENTDPQPLTPDPQGEAEACFQKAIDVARRQRAKLLELRAVMSLVRLRQQQAQDYAPRTTQHESRIRLDAAHNTLSEVYNWFTEGFDTKDLQEARTLLEELK
jgi:DNA-binding winged helix-turn-helix (wHTH) protein/predicted ATPase